jgi:hypothetical protein
MRGNTTVRAKAYDKIVNDDNKLIVDRDSENQSLLVRWGNGYFLSEDRGDIIIDYDIKGNVIGIELLRFEPENMETRE